MNTPSWFLKNNLLAYALWPISLVYLLFAKIIFILRKIRQKNAKLPVICIGGLMAGGVGKTPIVRDIAQKLYGSVVVMRGYGGKKSGIVSKSDFASDIGDEAKMLSSYIPVITGSNRVASVNLAANMGFKTIVMDDGFQNPTVKKDISILVFDEKLGIGNGFALPAGPMRGLLTSGIKRCDAVIIIKKNVPGKSFSKILNAIDRFNKPVFYAKTENITRGIQGKVVAFAGIGYPEKFFEGLVQILKSRDADASEFIGFSDHHAYTDKELDTLVARANKIGAMLVTTEKDWVRLPVKYQKKIKFVPMVVEIEKLFWTWFKKKTKD